MAKFMNQIVLYDEDGQYLNYGAVAKNRDAALRKGFKYLVQFYVPNANDFHLELAFRTKADAIAHIKEVAQTAYTYATLCLMHGSNIYGDGSLGDYHYQSLSYVTDFYNKLAN